MSKHPFAIYKEHLEGVWPCLVLMVFQELDLDDVHRDMGTLLVLRGTMFEIVRERRYKHHNCACYWEYIDQAQDMLDEEIRDNEKRGLTEKHIVRMKELMLLYPIEGSADIEKKLNIAFQAIALKYNGNISKFFDEIRGKK